MKKLIAICLAGCFGVVANAQISVVGPFTGALQENLESQTEVFHVGSVSIMGGEMTVASATDEVGIYSGGWGLGNKGSLNYSGKILFANDGTKNPFSITFTNTVSDFGGEWNAADFNNDITYSFYDANNNLIGTDVFVTPFNNVLNWRGWHSTVGIKRIDVSGGESIPMDNFQANLVPEPASLIALGLGLAAVARRRKSA